MQNFQQYRRLSTLVLLSAAATLLSSVARAVQTPVVNEGICEALAQPRRSTEFMALLVNQGRHRELQFLREALLPVLEEGARGDLASFRLLGAGVLGIEVSSEVGTYRYELTDDPNEEDPQIGSPEVVRVGESSVSADLKILYEKIRTRPEEVIGKIRSSWRSDPFLHPALRVPNDEKRATVLTYPQRQAVDVLSQWDQGAFMASTGIGKTIVAAHVYKNTFGNPEFCRLKQWSKKGKVIFVLENNEALESAVSTFKRELGFRDIARIFGSTTGQQVDSRVEMIAITRSSYYARMSEIHDLIKSDPTQPWFFVFDEAHHLGTEGGQFEEIIRDLQGFTDPHYHRSLSLSATLWHNESKDLIRKLFRGNVWGPYLNDEELTRLRSGEDLDQLSRIQLQRTTEQGYLSPNEGVRIIRHVGNQPALELLDQSTRTKKHTHVDIPSDLVADLAEQILRLRLAHTPDRGVIYVPSRLHANGYAAELQKLLGDSEVRALHRGENLEGSEINVKDTLNWIKDEGDHYDNLTNRRKHKYMIVVDMMKEAVDIPCINMLVFLEPYSISMEGLRNYLQEYGRGTRLHALKTGLRQLDYSGFTEVFGGEGLKFISVGSKPDGGTSEKGRERRISMLTIDGEPITATEFDRISAGLQHQIGMNPIAPHFNSSAFSRSAWVALANEARSRKFNFELESGASTYLIYLIRAFQDASVKTQLRSNFDRIKGWRKADGQFCKNGDSAACLRLYQGLRLIAEAIKENGLDATNPLRIDLLDDLEHGYAETEKILDILLPERNRTTRVFDNLNANEVTFFVEGRGDGNDTPIDSPLEKLIAQLSRFLQDPLGADGARRGLDFIVSRLPEFAGYELLKREIDAIAFARDDIKRAQRMVREPILRIYTALRIIATYLARHGFDIDPLRVNESLTMERLLRVLFAPWDKIPKGPQGLAVTSVPRLNAGEAADFYNEKRGSLPVLVNLAAALKIDFYSETGPRELSRALWAALPAGPSKEACRAALDGLDAEWTKGDGRAAAGSERRLRSINRYFELLFHVGNALRSAGDAIEPLKLFLRDEFFKLTQMLFPLISLNETHRWSKPAEDADLLAKFVASPGGALPTFMDVAARFDLRPSAEYTTREYLFALIAPLQDNEAKRTLQAEIEGISWPKTDYDTIRSGSLAAGRRFFRLIQKVAVLYGIGSFDDLPPMSQDDQAQNLLNHVFESYHRSDRILRMSASERKRFGDMESGATRAINDRAQALHISLRQSNGISVFVDRLCDALPQSPRREELVRTIHNLKWKLFDGQELATGTLAQDRMHETLLRILRYLKGLPGYAGAFRKVEAINIAQRDVVEKIFTKLFDEGTQANATPLLRKVRLSASIPEVDDKKIALFNDPETGARVSIKEHGQRRFIAHWKPGFSRLSMLEYALLLPESARKAEVVKKIRDMDWSARDFEGLTRNLRASTQRYFTSLALLAWALNPQEEGFRSILSRADADALLSSFPDFVSLPTKITDDEIALFTDPTRGALAALAENAQHVGIDLEHLEGFISLVEIMRTHCPAGIQKTELQKELSAALPAFQRPYFQWTRGGNVKALVQIYRFLYAAAALYQIGGAHISMNEMLGREGVEKLFKLLR